MPEVLRSESAARYAIAMMQTTTAQPSCPECGGSVEYDSALWHCDQDGAWDRASLVWTDGNGRIVDDPSEYTRRAIAARAMAAELAQS